MRRLAGLLAPLVLLLAVSVPSASAHVVACSFEQQQAGTCHLHTATPGAPDTPGPGGGAPADPNAPYTERRYVPACGYNNTVDGDVMCVGATVLCDPQGEELTAFWVWTRTVYPATGRVSAWERQSGFTCLGGDDPAVPSTAAAAAAVQDAFQRFVLVKGRTTINPGAKTLVDVDTIFSTDVDQPVALDPFPLLTHTIHLTITPESYTWHFGDGQTLTTTSPGAPGVKDVVHRYTAPASVEAYVVITWSGSFTVDGGEAIQVRGTATTTGPTTALSVREARAELVDQG